MNYQEALPQGPQARADAPKVIDMHGHCGAPDADAMLAERPERKAEMGRMAAGSGAASMVHNGQVMLPAAGARMANLEKRLQDLDWMGIDLQVVSPSPILYADWADEALASDVVGAANAAATALVARAPDRLASMGIVAMQHPELAATQLKAAHAAGLKGIEISASVADRGLDDPSLEPFWAAANETAMPIFIHPLGTSLGARLDKYYLSNAIGQPIETTIGLNQMIFAGVFDRFPDLRVVAAHGGGYLPAYIGRSDHTWRVRPEARTCEELPSSYLRRIWFDTVVFDAAQLTALVARVGADRVMFGTDYPFDMSDCDPAAVADSLAETDRAPVMGGTAADLFGL